MTDRDHPDLLTRRKRDTEREIAAAALDLFESQGVAHTTVEQIAERAGISPRTFFRYSATKEASVLLGGTEVDDSVDAALEPDRLGTDPVKALEQAFADGIAELDTGSTAMARRVLRMRRLAATEPALIQAMLRADLERGERVTAKLAEALGVGRHAFEAKAVVAVLNTTVRITFEEWTRRLEAGEHPSIAELYAQARKAVRDAAST
ncbi:TetR family transcriptional regulator [Sciscionella marina]|uniref:TetR family transcriptional regulator n=1 Tax=Sciscionella marina TaxID=508770 RepID=UPI00037F8C03|nr:TetR family transcriptional regulator [Sciscionella marina]